MANVLKKTLWTYLLSVFLDGNMAVIPKSRLPVNNPMLAVRWSVDILKEKVSVSNLKQIESGFDLDDNEIKKFKIWPNGIIPYYIDDISYDKVLRDRIRSFLEVTGGLTGLHFRELHSPPVDDKTRWVFFINRLGTLGCADHTTLNFTNEGVQKVILGYNCMSEGGELPEAVLSIVGVPPQHNAPNRDDFIAVVPNNILPEKKYLFEKLQDNEWLFHDLNYDFNSAGHFSYHKHTLDGLATIRPKRHLDQPVGEHDGFSYTDILKIHMLYNYISKKKSSTIQAPECNKLFQPGNNFNRFKPDSTENEIPPREKPRKYLGLPELPETKTKLTNNVNGTNDDGDHGNIDSDAYISYGDCDGDGKNNEGEESECSGKSDKDENGSKSDKGDGENGDNSIPKRKQKLKKIDPLSLLSDYDTDDAREKTKAKRGKKRAVKN